MASNHPPHRPTKEQREQALNNERHNLPSMEELCARFQVKSRTIEKDLQKLRISLKDLGKQGKPGSVGPGGDTVDTAQALRAATTVNSSTGADPALLPADDAVRISALPVSGLLLANNLNTLRTEHNRYGEPDFDHDDLSDALSGAVAAADAARQIADELDAALSAEPGASPEQDPIDTLRVLSQELTEQQQNLEEVSGRWGGDPDFNFEELDEAVHQFVSTGHRCVGLIEELHPLLRQNPRASNLAVPVGSVAGQEAADLIRLNDAVVFSFDEFAEGTDRLFPAGGVLSDEDDDSELLTELDWLVVDVVDSARAAQFDVHRMRETLLQHDASRQQPVIKVLEQASQFFLDAEHDMEMAYWEFQRDRDIDAFYSSTGTGRASQVREELHLGAAMLRSAHELLLPTAEPVSAP